MAPTKGHGQLDQFREQILEVVPDPASRFMLSQVSFIERSWRNVSDHFYETLGQFYGVSLIEPDLTCYLVRTDIYPYDYKDTVSPWFTAPLFTNHLHRNAKIRHELCHYYQPDSLPRVVKEALPAILNDDSFEQYWPDRGNQDEEEQNWRNIILDLYKHGKKFSDLLNMLPKEQG
ncbi:MAG: hypothetical protein GHCLOJNM_00190 [bacterium]|nr:hypothetical protein [bacterium]